MAGMDIRKAKSAARLRERPLATPPEMVLPERDRPGRMATACITPMATASYQRTLLCRLWLRRRCLLMAVPTTSTTLVR